MTLTATRPISSADKNAKVVATFDDLPPSAFVAGPVVEAILGNVSRATVWRMVKDGRLPAPVKLAPNVARWKVGALREAIGRFQPAEAA